MANIGRYGGKITITSSTSPSGHKIETVSKHSDITGVTTGTTWTGYVGEYTGADDRDLNLSVKITTNEDSSYQGTASVTCGWTVTQEGTGSTPVGNKYVPVLIAYSGSSSDTFPGVTVEVITDDNSDDFEIRQGSWMNPYSEDLDIGYATGVTFGVTLHTTWSANYTVRLTYGSQYIAQSVNGMYMNTVWLPQNQQYLSYVGGQSLTIQITPS